MPSRRNVDVLTIPPLPLQLLDSSSTCSSQTWKPLTLASQLSAYRRTSSIVPHEGHPPFHYFSKALSRRDHNRAEPSKETISSILDLIAASCLPRLPPHSFSDRSSLILAFNRRGAVPELSRSPAQRPYWRQTVILKQPKQRTPQDSEKTLHLPSPLSILLQKLDDCHETVSDLLHRWRELEAGTASPTATTFR